MSDSTDKRIVEMQFDNKQFNRGIEESSKLLEQFEKNLRKFGDISEHTASLQKAVDKVDFTNLVDGVEKLTEKFLILGEISTTVLEEISKKAAMTGDQLMNAMPESKSIERTSGETTKALDAVEKKVTEVGEEASKSSAEVEKSFNRVEFDGLASSVESISGRFTALGIIGVTALQRISNQAIDTGERMIKSLSIDQISSGYAKMDQLTTATQTLRSNGYAMGDIERQLAMLMSFSDETSYSFTDMTSNLAKFTSQGLELDKSATALRGIAAWAAAAGQNSQTASRAMYNISQSLGAGKMMTVDWRSIELANMATAEFKQAALDAAVATGKLIKQGNKFYATTEKGKQIEVSVQNFRETLTYDWFDTATMMSVFQRYGSFADLVNQIQTMFDLDNANDAMDMIDELRKMTKEQRIEKMIDEGVAQSVDDATQKLSLLNLTYDELAEKAYRAAQEAKTFSEAIAATKDAVSSKWMKTFQLIFGNYEQQKDLWTDVANRLWDIFAEGGDRRNEMLEEWSKKGGTLQVVNAIHYILDAIYNLKTAATDAFRDVFGETTSDNLFDFTTRITSIAYKIREFTKDSEKMKQVSDIFHGIASALKILLEIGRGVARVGKNLWNAIFPGTTIFDSVSKAGAWITNFERDISERGYIGAAVESASNILTTVAGWVGNFLGIGKTAEKGKGVGSFLSEVLSGIAEPVAKVASKLDPGKIMSISMGIGALINLFKLLKIQSSISEVLDRLTGGFSSLFDALMNLGSGSLPLKPSMLQAVAILVAALGSAINNVASAIKTIGTMDIATVIGGMAGVAVIFGALVWMLGIIKGYLNSLKFGSTSKLIGIGVYIYAVGAAVKNIAWAIAEIGELGLEKATIGVAGLAASLFLVKTFFTSLSGLFDKTLIGEKGFFFKKDKVIQKETANLLSMGASLVMMGIAMRQIASAVSVMGNLGLETMLTGIMGLGGVLLGLALFFRIAGNMFKEYRTIGPDSDNKQTNGLMKMGASLLMMGFAMKSFASAISVIGSLGLENMITGVAGLELMLLSITSFFAMTKGLSKDIDGWGMVKMAASMVLMGYGLKAMASAVSTVGSLGLGNAIVGVAGLELMLLSVASFFHIISNLTNGSSSFGLSIKGISSEKTGHQFLKMAASMVLIGYALEEMAVAVSKIGNLGLGNAIVGIAGMELMLLSVVSFFHMVSSIGTETSKFEGNLGGFSSDKTKNGLIKMSLAMIGIGAAMNLLAEAVNRIGSMDLGALVKGIAGFEVIMWSIAGFMKVIDSVGVSANIGQNVNVKNNFAIKMLALIPLALSLGMISDVIGRLGAMDTAPLLKGLVAMGAMMFGLSATFRVIAGTSFDMSSTIFSIIQLTAIVIAMNAFADIFTKVKDVKFETMAGFGLGIAEVFAGIGFGIKSINAIPIGSALAGLGKIALIIALVGAALAGIGALEGDTQAVSSLIRKGGDVLTSVSESLGSFIGGLIGGIGKGITASGAAIGTNLSDFMTNLKPFLDGLQNLNIPNNALDSIGKIVGIVMKLGEANLSDAINSFLAGRNTFTFFKEGLTALGDGMKSFVTSVGSLSTGQISNASDITKVADSIADIQVKVSTIKIGGLNSILTGRAMSLTELAGGIKDLGEAMGKFVYEVNGFGLATGDGIAQFKGFTTENITIASDVAAIAGALSEINTQVSQITDGGWTSIFTGKRSTLTTLSTGIKALGSAMGKFVYDVNGFGLAEDKANGIAKFQGFTKENVTLATDVTAITAALADIDTQISNITTGGWDSLFTGKAETLTSFSDGIGALGKAMGKYVYDVTHFGEAEGQGVTKIKGFTAQDVSIATDITTIATTLSEIETAVNKIKLGSPVSDLFSGKQATLTDFAAELPGLGVALQSYVGSLSEFSDFVDVTGNKVKLTNKDVDLDKVERITGIAVSFADFVGKLPKEGGVFSWFTGDNHWKDIKPENMEGLGTALSSYVTALNTFKGDTTNLAAANTAIDSLGHLFQLTPPTGGFAQWFAGTQDIGAFAGKFGDVGTGLNTFVTNLLTGSYSKNIDLAEGALQKFERFAAIQSQIVESISVKNAQTGTTVSSKTFNQSILDQFFQAVGNSAKHINKFAEEVGKESSGISKYFDSIKIDNAIYVATKFADVVSALGSVELSKNMYRIQDLTYDLSKTGAGGQTLGGVLNTFAGSLGNFAVAQNVSNAEAAVKIVQDISKAIQSMAEVTNTVIGNPVIILSDFINELTGLSFANFDSDSAQAASAFIGGIGTILDGAVKAADDPTYVDKMASAGSDLVQGLANGISSNPAAVNAMQELANNLILTVKTVTDSHSPSRVFRSLGMYLDEGLAQGIDAYANNPESSMRGLAGALNRIGGDMLRDLDDGSPTITPVLDLSNVRAGASTISDIFNTRRTLSASVTAGRIASQMRGGGNVQNITNNYYNNQNQSSNLNVGNMRMENEMDARALASEMDLMNRRARRGYGA